MPAGTRVGYAQARADIFWVKCEGVRVRHSKSSIRGMRTACTLHAPDEGQILARAGAIGFQDIQRKIPWEVVVGLVFSDCLFLASCP